MRRARLAPAFVTTVVSSGCAWALSGCAWTLGGGAQYTHTGQAQNAVAVVGRAAWGFGDKRNTLVIASDLAMGASPSHGSFWAQSMPRLEYAWLPRRGRAGLRLGAGGLVASGVDSSLDFHAFRMANAAGAGHGGFSEIVGGIVAGFVMNF